MPADDFFMGHLAGSEVEPSLRVGICAAPEPRQPAVARRRAALNSCPLRVSALVKRSVYGWRLFASPDVPTVDPCMNVP